MLALLAIAVNNILKPLRMRQMIVDFYRHFIDVKLAIGTTQAISVGGLYAFATWER